MHKIVLPDTGKPTPVDFYYITEPGNPMPSCPPNRATEEWTLITSEPETTAVPV